MGRRSVRVTDLHTCPMSTGTVPHVGGPVLPPGCPTVLIGGLPAARKTDLAACVGGIDVIKQGAGTVLIGGQPAARLGDETEHGGKLVTGFATVLIGKVLFLRIVIVAGSTWDTPAGRAEIDRQLREAERIMDITIITGPFETVNDPALLNVPAGNWTNGDNYSTGQTGAVNTYGAPGRPVAIYTNSSGDGAAIAVSRGWQGNNPVGNEGIIVGSNAGLPNERATAHELGHLLSNEAGNNTHANTDPTNLMDPHASGDNWTDPWRSSAERNPYLQ